MRAYLFTDAISAPRAIERRLEDAVERHITEYGVKEFVLGRCNPFYDIAGMVIHMARLRHPEVRLYYLPPYYDPEDEWWRVNWSSKDYPPEMRTIPEYFTMEWAHRCMVESSEYLIVYAIHSVWPNGLVEYAKKNGLHIENLAEEEPAASDGQPL